MAGTTNINTYTVTKNGDKLQLSNVLEIDGCHDNIEVTLPTVTGGTVYYTGDAPVGTWTGDKWLVGAKKCEDPDIKYTFNWCVEVTDIENISGTYSGLGVTTTTQDTVDDGVEITIEKVCPEIGMEGPKDGCETVETIVCYQPTPTVKPKKKQFEKIQVRTSKRMGAVKRKIALKKEESCGLDNLKVG